MSRIERSNDKFQRAAAKREAEEMAKVADEFKLDPLGDFARETSTPYDQELGRITDEDREYARDLLDDIHDGSTDSAIEIVAQWLRKARYEAVIADRKKRS